MIRSAFTRHLAVGSAHRSVFGFALLLAIPIVSLAESAKDDSGAKNVKQSAEVPVEVHFTDNSVLKMGIREERIELTTSYGKLYIPVGDIRKIEFGLRVSDEIAKRVDAAVEDLGNTQFRRREAASAILLAQREKAFAAVIKATKNQDMEVANRAEELVKKLQETVSADLLKQRDYDLIYTEHSKIAGRIDVSAIRANTTQFGEVRLKLADVYTLTSKNAEVEPDLSTAATAPTNMVNFHNEIGKTFVFKVTANASGSLWGTDIYSTDSTLATAVIHAGILTPGQTGVIRVTMMPSPNIFVGSTRNGVTSSPYQQYPAAYRLSK